MKGRTLSHYAVRDHLGDGGMGVVYHGFDTRLNRPVALKFLAPELSQDPAAKEQFMREARAASALDHPNICTIYDVDETPDGQIFLAMAYVDGETLKETIARGPLPIDDILDIGAQIAQALVKAHGAGIVHRDIKPANVMITADRLVKIVDFGIAKLVGDITITKTGGAVGTLAYMSPEQIRGEPVDYRTDLWSLGAVLYEMTSGERPFRADHAGVTSNAIVQDQPKPLTSLRSGVPMDLERIVIRAMAKRKEDRYQTAADLLSEIRRLQRDWAQGGVPPGEGKLSPPAVHRRQLKRGVLLVLVVAGVALAWSLSRLRSSSERLLVFANPMQVTTAVGVEDSPAWSPDNRTLAFAANPTGSETTGGDWDIWVAQVGGQPLNRTADSPAADRFPSWSPDGRQIAFWSDRDNAGCFVMPALTGNARKVAPASLLDPNPPQWSADGGQLTCVATDNNQVFADVLSIRTGTSRRVLLEGEPGRRTHLSWSPDNRLFAYVASSPGLGADATQLWVLRLSDGKAFPITDGRTKTWSPTWSPDARELYFVSNLGQTMDLWRQRVGEDGGPIGQPTRLTTGIGMRAAAMSRDGTRLSYSQGRRVANVWRVPILEQRPAAWADAHQITFDQAFIEYLDVSPDGTRLLISSDRSGNPDIWVLPVEGGDMEPVVSDPAPDWGPAWSPNGRDVAFFSHRSGNRDVWVISLHGGAAQQLTDNPAADVFPSWSPEGQRIVFSSNRGGIWRILISPAKGGDATEVKIPFLGGRSYWSPDGKWLAVFGGAAGMEIWRVSVPGAAPPLRLAKNAAQICGDWSPDGRTFFFVGSGKNETNVHAVSIDGSSQRQMTVLSGRRGAMGCMTTDGRNLFFTWEEDLGDLWVMDVVARN